MNAGQTKPDPFDPEHYLQTAIAAAKAGAVELLDRRSQHQVFEKSPKDLVTDADLASQDAIEKLLLGEHPESVFVGEEQGMTLPAENVRLGDKDAPPCWVVDPLDGTVNYVHQLQSFAVSIGLYYQGEMKLGVVYDPVGQEMFTGIAGKSATCNGKPIAASGCETIREALLACSFPAGVRGDDPAIARFIRVLEQCQSVRRLGSCALNLCYVAAGRLDGYWVSKVSAWDAAAGSVIAKTAGATMTAHDGSPMDDWDPRFCVAASESLQSHLRGILAGEISSSI